MPAASGIPGATRIRKLHISNAVGENKEVNLAGLARDRLWTGFLTPQPESVIAARPLFPADHVTTVATSSTLTYLARSPNVRTIPTIAP